MSIKVSVLTREGTRKLLGIAHDETTFQSLLQLAVRLDDCIAVDLINESQHKEIPIPSTN